MAIETIIGQQIFDIEYAHDKPVHELQDKISFLFHNEVVPGMKNYFEASIPAEFVFKIDSLTIDIGTLSYDQLDKLLPFRIQQELEKAIADHLYRYNHFIPFANGRGLQVLEKSARDLETLEFFLEFGAFPWWIRNFSVNDMGNRVVSLAGSKKERLFNLLMQKAQFENVRKRMAFQFNDTVIRSIIPVMEPVNADFILQYQRNIVSVQQTTQVVKAPVKQFAQDVWYFILTQITVDRGSVFNQKQFVKSNLQMIAGKYNVSYQQVLRVFSSSVHLGQLPKISEGFLPSIIDELQQEANLEQEAALPVRRRKNTDSPLIELLINYLATGSIKLVNSYTAPDEMLKTFLHLLKTQPGQLFSLINTLDNVNEVIERIKKMGIQEENFLKHIITAVAGSEENLFLRYFSELEKKMASFPLLPFVKDDFTKEQLTIFITYLVTTQGKVKLKNYIELHDRLMSEHYRIETTLLLPWINSAAENIVQTMEADERNLKHTEDTKPKRNRTLSQKTDENREKESVPHVDRKPAKSAYLLNFWIYYLTTGQKPWWALKQDIREAVELFAKENIEARMAVLKYAGIDAVYRNRFVSVFPFSFISDTLTQYETKIGYTGMIEQTLGMILASNRIPVNYHQQASAMVIDSFWTELADTGYKGITVTGFFRRLLIKLPAVLQVDAFSFIGDLQFILKTKRVKGFDEQVKNSFLLLKSEMKNKLDQPLEMQWLTLGYVFSSGFDTDRYFQHTLLQRIKEVFRYYLYHGAMPRELLQPGLGVSDNLLIDLVYYLYKHSRSFLESMVAESAVSVKAVNSILLALRYQTDPISKDIAAILSAGSKEMIEPSNPAKMIGKPVSSFFRKELTNEYVAGYFQSSSFMVSDIEIEAIRVFAYYKENDRFPASLKTASTGLKERILLLAVTALFRKDPRLLEYSLYDEQVPARTIRSLLDLFKMNTSGSGLQIKTFLEQLLHTKLLVTAQKSAIWQAETDLDEEKKYYPDVKTADRILRFYILRGFLPGGIPAMPVYAQKLFIKNMIFWLYESNQKVLDRVFRDMEVTENKLSLFELFEDGLNDRENRVISFLQPFRKTDAVVFLQKQLGFGLEINEALEVMLEKETSVGDFLKKAARFTSVAGLLVELKSFDKVWLKFAEESAHNSQYVHTINSIIQLFEKSRKDLVVGENLMASLALFLFSNIYRIESLMQDDQMDDLVYSYLQQIYLKVPIGFLAALRKNISESNIPPFVKKADQWQERFNKLIERSKLDGNVRDNVFRYADKVYGNPRAGNMPMVNMNNEISDISKADKRKKENSDRGNKKEVEEHVDKTYINNAGLVLLAPFFSTYFSKLGLTQSGNFINEEARHKALHLLQYLVDGKTIHDEQELFLNKILCGMDIDEPVTMGFDLEEKDREVTEDLLQVVIKQWDKLNNISVESFRHSFLIREGYIGLDDGNWKLQVISRGYDVLLQFIPWTYGMIRNSLMDKILYVEWI